MARPARGFAPPPEVPRYFADRGLKPRFSYLDVWAEEHAQSFTVAKAVEAELLKALFNSLQSAIEGGQSYETWRDGLKPELERLGWWGKRKVADPEGIDRPRNVDFSAPRRLKTIFWSNMRAARAAGQWERAQRTKKALPYFLYVRTTSQEPRPEHLAWAGIILPVDDPFWRTHFPPNGWMCKCSVRQISARERDAYATRPGYSLERPTIDMEPFINRRTGEVTYVPKGIDPGWHSNPGMARQRWKAGSEAFDRNAQELVADAVKGAAATPTLTALRTARLHALRAIVQERMASPEFPAFHHAAVTLKDARRTASLAARLSGADQHEMRRAADIAAPWTMRDFAVAVMPERLIGEWEGGSPTVMVNDAGMTHGRGRHTETVEDWRRLQSVLDEGEVYRSEIGGRLWIIGEADGQEWLVVLSLKAGRWRPVSYYAMSKASAAKERAKKGRMKILNATGQ